MDETQSLTGSLDNLKRKAENIVCTDDAVKTWIWSDLARKCHDASRSKRAMKINREQRDSW